MEENRLKQRLVGAVVLVALAVIFIPILLSGGRDMEMPVFGSNVPERSAAIKNVKHLDTAEMDKAQLPPATPKRVPIAHNLPEPKVVKTPKSSFLSSSSTSTLDKSLLPKKSVWVVQVGSFKNRKNALKLKDKLLKKKISAFVERVVRNDKPVYRVRVGPEIKRDKAEAMRKKLKKIMKLNGLVVKHP